MPLTNQGIVSSALWQQGWGLPEKDLKAMADQGQLTIDKVVPALVSQLGVLQGEFSALPPTVSGSMQKVTNSFYGMGWWGEPGNWREQMHFLGALMGWQVRWILLHLPLSVGPSVT